MSDFSALMPDEIDCKDQIFDLAFHPKFDALAVGLINGAVQIYKYETDAKLENKLMLTCDGEDAACRGVMFTDDGERLYSISADKSIRSIDGIGRVVLSIPHAHEDPVNKIIALSEGGSVFATGMIINNVFFQIIK